MEEFCLSDFYQIKKYVFLSKIIIYSLCNRSHETLSTLGKEFSNIFNGRDAVNICLTLISSFKECNLSEHRLIILYFIYKLESVGTFIVDINEEIEGPEILTHPFLFIFVKVYIDFLKTYKKCPEFVNNLPLEVQQVQFSTITFAEARFIAYILCEKESDLTLLFNYSPKQLTTSALINTHSYRFLYPSLLDPAHVKDDWQKDEEWTKERMRPLAGVKNTEEFTQTNALQILQKMRDGEVSTISRTDIMRLNTIINEDNRIFANVDMLDGFFKIIEYFPDIAAQLLIYEMVYDKKAVDIHLEIILNMELSVHVLLTVNKFIASCESKQLKIPENFLNMFITYCMNCCERVPTNQSLLHRLVRLVCVFFNTLIRLKNFDAKPRLPEMLNFSMIYLSLKEASTLYKSIQQIE